MHTHNHPTERATMPDVTTPTLGQGVAQVGSSALEPGGRMSDAYDQVEVTSAGRDSVMA
jgi:hypothetical protein